MLTKERNDWEGKERVSTTTPSSPFSHHHHPSPPPHHHWTSTDERYHKLLEVERLLATAEYGDDFEPTDPSHHLRASVITTSTTPLHPTLKVTGREGEREGK